MLTKASAKFIKSLQLKKYRKQENLFLVEGTKSVLEVLESRYEVHELLATSEFIDHNLSAFTGKMTEASKKELAKLGTFNTNDGALAVVKQLPNSKFEVKGELAIALDDINDPGNLGTILRIADWYGIRKVIASENTVDLYNPKVIAASKGSFTRIDVFYTPLQAFLHSQDELSFGAMMNGDNIHSMDLPKTGIIVLGNEANGISPEVSEILDHRITIPRFGTAESLNVAMATAIICDNFKRKN